ncbi:MAG: FAD/NAD(P)-binding protein [Candidatus Thorarchaeota archaeon]
MTLINESENPFQPQPARIVRQYDLIKDHRFFQIRFIDMERAMSFKYKPGQFAMLSIPGVGEAPFSISSTPSRPGILEMGIRRVGKVTEALYKKKDNDVIYVRGPYGNGFKIEPMVERDIIIVAGGLGVIPLRSILYYVLDNRDQFDELYFLYGSRNPDEFLFKNEFFQIKERTDVDCFYTVDKDPSGTWPENVGVVTKLFKQLPKIDPTTTTAVVCGPPVMYKYVIQELLKLKIPKNMIQMTLERRMRCGIGKCGHCALDHIYTCMDGPVFTYWDTLHFRELI